MNRWLNSTSVLALVTLAQISCVYREYDPGTDVDPAIATGGTGGTSSRPHTGGTAGTTAPAGGAGGTAGTAAAPTGTADGAAADGAVIATDGASGDTLAPAPTDAAGDVPVGPAHAFMVTGVAPWRGGATAAYSVVHETVCLGGLAGALKHGDPELMQRGLHGGFAIVANECTTSKLWPQVKALVTHGHDVINQTYTHPCLTNNATLAKDCDTAAKRSVDYATEVDKAATELMTQTGAGKGFFMFPYEVCDPAAVTRVKASGFVGSLCGALGVNSATLADPFKSAFDPWGPAFSSYYNAGACKGAVTQFATTPDKAPAACRSYVLNQAVTDAITKKGWAVRVFHGFNDDTGSFEPITLAEYRTHLDFVAAQVKAGTLWVEGPTTVVKYHQARTICPMPTVTGGVLKFAAPTPDCLKYGTDLSYLVSTTDGADLANVSVMQAGRLLPGKKLGAGSYIVDADPSKGDAQLVAQ